MKAQDLKVLKFKLKDNGKAPVLKFNKNNYLHMGFAEFYDVFGEKEGDRVLDTGRPIDNTFYARASEDGEIMKFIGKESNPYLSTSSLSPGDDGGVVYSDYKGIYNIYISFPVVDF